MQVAEAILIRSLNNLFVCVSSYLEAGAVI